MLPILMSDFRPPNIPGLKLWLDASRIQGLADGAAVTVWPDLSAPGAPFYDSFDRADSATTLGSPWTALTGTWGISGNKAYCVSDATGHLVLTDTGLADGAVSCVVSGQLSGANKRVPIVVFRALDAANLLFSSLDDGYATLYKIDGGSLSLLGSTVTTTTDNTDYTLRVVCSGNAITIAKDGTTLITYTLSGADTKYAAYTRIGMRLSKSGAPTTPARWDNFLVSRLTDAVQTTVASKPTFKTAVQNGRPVVRFDGVDDLLVALNSDLSGSDMPFTAYLISKGTNIAACALSLSGSSSNNQHMQIRPTDSPTQAAVFRRDDSGTGEIRLIQSQTSQTGFHITAVVFSGTTCALGIDGNSVAAAMDTGTLTLNQIGVGGLARLSPAAFFAGDISEVLLYIGAHTAPQRRRVERHLARKWGITLTRQVVEDTFTRADSAVSLGNVETGQAWQVIGTGAAGISGNAGYLSTAGGLTIATVDAGVSDGTAQLTLSTHSPNALLAFRLSDINNFFMVQEDVGAYKLWKRAAGAFSLLGTYAVTPANGDVLRVVLSGSSVKFLLNGTERISVADSFNQTATRFGWGDSDSTDARFDNFTVEV